MSPELSIRLFGSFQLTYASPVETTSGDTTALEPLRLNSPRLHSLLAYLLLHEGPQSRQQLAFALWPESAEGQARTNLRKLLLQLRRALPNADTFVELDGQTIQWRADAPYRCDAHELQKHFARVAINPLDEAAYQAIVDLYRGELLPGGYDEWIEPLRREFRERALQAMRALLGLQENRRAHEQAIDVAQQMLRLDPLDEETNRRLMRLRALNHDRAGALQHYQQFAALLYHELDVEPDRQTQALYKQILDGKLQEAATPAKPSRAVPELPLVGRQAEWQRLQGFWQESVSGHSRLVLITGVAGMGKTRLAEELLHWATLQGAITARSRSYAAQGAMAYAPVAELLRADLLNERLHRLPEPRLIPLVRILPELLDDYPDLPLPEPMVESWQRQHFQDALTHAITAHNQPLVLLLDDLQWCDGETLAWLDHLLHTNTGQRLLVVGTVRGDEIDMDHPLTGIQSSLRRDDLLGEIALSPLSVAETSQLAETVAQDASVEAGQPPGELVDEIFGTIFDDTEGNPLFVVETVRARQGPPSGGESSVSSAGLPPKVYAVIQSRLAQLTPEAQRIANLAAVVGRSFTFAVLQEASFGR